MTPEVAMARDEVVRHLVELERMFTEGMRLTFVAHHPDHAERELVVTNAADLLEVVAVLERRARAGKDQ